MSARLVPSMPAGRRFGLGLALVGALAAAPIAARAQGAVPPADDELPADTLPADQGRWHFEREQSNGLAAPLAPPRALQPGGGSQAQTQTMLWARRERLGLGFGVEQRWPPVGMAPAHAAAPAGRDAGMRVGLSWATGESSQITWSAPLLPQRLGDGGAWPGVDRPAERDLRLGLEFRKTDALANLRRGTLLKLELSRETTLSLKPRGGRLGLTLTSHW